MNEDPLSKSLLLNGVYLVALQMRNGKQSVDQFF